MKTAWHVDDDEEMIRAISLMMQLIDYTTIPFLKARSAAEKFQNGERPDLLVLDINMPEVSGIDMLEYVRGKETLNDLPVIMLSSEDTDIQVKEALDKGADGYVMKPVSLDELEEVILKAFENRSM